jgi:endonuclease/exonuclease/phosphatase family metal-dependent hydrolase
VSTALRTASWNLRNKTAIADLAYPKRSWSRRLPAIVKLLDHVAPSVFGVQECRDDMAVDVTRELGPEWNFFGSGTAKVIWNHNKWNVLDQAEHKLPYKNYLGLTAYRPLTLIKLESITTQASSWFASTHLVVHQPNEATQRVNQAKMIVQVFSQLPGFGPALPIMLFGDFNDVGDNVGVRRVFAAAGYKPLRARLTDAEMSGDSTNSFNGWKPTRHDGRWLDDVLTAAVIDPYKGTIFKADPSSLLPVFASDHNLVHASVKIPDLKELV